MKILIFHPFIAPYRIDLFNAIAARHETSVCLFMRNLPDNPFDVKRLESQMDFTPKYLLKRHNLGICRVPKGMTHEIRNFNPDVVLLSEYGAKSLVVALYCRLFRKKTRLISIVDDSFAMTQGDNHFNKISHTLEERVMLPLVDDIINVEPRVADYFQKKYKKGQYFPIVAEDTRIRGNYAKALPLSKEYIHKYNLAGKRIFLYVGRLLPLKNIPFIIRAFREADIPDSRLIIVGDGIDRKNCQRTAAECYMDSAEHVIFTGRLEGKYIDAWYNIAHVHILASWQEAFGAVTNEALLGGCFSLVSAHAGSACLIEDGVNGYIFDPYDRKYLTECMSKLADKIETIQEEPQLRPSRMVETFAICFGRMAEKLGI